MGFPAFLEWGIVRLPGPQLDQSNNYPLNIYLSYKFCFYQRTLNNLETLRKCLLRTKDNTKADTRQSPERAVLSQWDIIYERCPWEPWLWHLWPPLNSPFLAPVLVSFKCQRAQLRSAGEDDLNGGMNSLDQVDLWVCLWLFVLIINWGGKSHPECGWRHYLDWGLNCVRVKKAR